VHSLAGPISAKERSVTLRISHCPTRAKLIVLVASLSAALADDQSHAGELHPDVQLPHRWPPLFDEYRAIPEDEELPRQRPVDECALYNDIVTKYNPRHDPYVLMLERSSCIDWHSDDYYFPKGTLFPDAPSSGVEQLFRQEFSRYLHAMREPSLSCEPHPGEVYRVLMLPSWGPPTVVRINLFGNRAVATTAQLEPKGLAVGTLDHWMSRSLTGKDVVAARRALDSAQFWKAPTADCQLIGYDGVQYLVEGRSGANYHAINRWSPDVGAVHNLIQTLLRLGRSD
jgi:hypothetical protein